MPKFSVDKLKKSFGNNPVMGEKGSAKEFGGGKALKGLGGPSKSFGKPEEKKKNKSFAAILNKK